MAAFHFHPFGWIILLAIVAYLIGALYIYAPFKVRRRQTKDVKVTYTPVELPEVPPEVVQAFCNASRGLVACGFHALGHVTRHTGNAAQNSFVSIWLNPSSFDEAQIIGIRTPSQLKTIRVVTLVTFRTEFSDGTSIRTSNTSSPGVYPRDPEVSTVRCPGVWDLALLYRFHRARVERDGAGRTATLDQLKDARTRMENEWAQTYQRLVEAGYFSLDQTRQKYIPTMKGAILMTYRLLPPFKQIQKFRRDRLAERNLRELGFGGMEEFRKAQSPHDVAGPASASS